MVCIIPTHPTPEEYAYLRRLEWVRETKHFLSTHVLVHGDWPFPSDEELDRETEADRRYHEAAERDLYLREVGG